MTDIEANLRETLRVALPHLASNVIDACATAEGIILVKTRETILAQLAAYASQERLPFRSETPAHFFYYDQVRYRLEIEPDTLHRSTLRVVIASADRVKSQMKRSLTWTPVDGLGRFTKVSVQTAKIYTQLQDEIADLTRRICEVGYRWLTEYVEESLQALQRETATALYGEIRKTIHPRLAENIWLFAAAGGKGFYILDPVIRQSALAGAKTSSISINLSPIEKLAIFETTKLDFQEDDLYSRRALADNNVLDVSFAATTYDTLFQVAEQEIYQATDFTVQPLVREGHTLLVAGYPSDIRKEVENQLAALRGSLVRTLDTHAQEVHRNVEALNTQGGLPGFWSKAGEFFGGIIKALAEP